MNKKKIFSTILICTMAISIITISYQNEMNKKTKLVNTTKQDNKKSSDESKYVKSSGIDPFQAKPYYKNNDIELIQLH